MREAERPQRPLRSRREVPGVAQNADAAVVAHCRKVGLPESGTGYRDIAVIQYNKTNGAVCFYQALSNVAPTLFPELPGDLVAAP